MRHLKSMAWLIAVACLLFLLVVGASAQSADNSRPVQVPEGTKQKIQGVVSIRDRDTFKVRAVDGAETTVVLTDNTKVTSHGFKKKTYPVTYIMRGLRLQAQGKGDAEGNLVADWVRFDEQDLRSAQGLEQTDKLAKENAERLARAEEAARLAAEEAKRMQGQIAENTALALAAQRTADQAFKDAALANNRINGLDDYEPIKLISVLFKVNSSVLNPAAKQAIDEAAAWASEEKAKGNANGWLVQVIGFADTTGKSAKNRALSEKRANAVIQYLVLKHGMDLRRLVQPFGYGENKPVANNKTAEGRAKNRRVEIKILQNKGIAMKAT
jgi:outer membrane protein OmpA-like peptidoglycan-associated protein